MNIAEAKEILLLYRPGTVDTNDPSFADALRLCEQDPELKRWFDDHCAVYAAVRTRFREITVPEGLKQQILAERKVHTTPFPRRTIVLVGVLAVAVLTGLLSLLPESDEGTNLRAFRAFMTRQALTPYGMHETNDLNAIRSYLAERTPDAGYVIPGELEKSAKPTGCVAATWQGKPYSMICFHSGKPLPPDQKSDLILFVTSDTSLTGRPAPATPLVKKENRAMTASWSKDGRTYLLVADGDEEFLRKYL
jgi:hypothetical protein